MCVCVLGVVLIDILVSQFDPSKQKFLTPPLVAHKPSHKITPNTLLVLSYKKEKTPYYKILLHYFSYTTNSLSFGQWPSNRYIK